MKIIRFKLFILLFICHTLPSVAQEWKKPYIQYTMKDGLPSNEVYDVIQDSIGYLWLTTDNGLCRFDGYEFKTYGIEKGLNDRVVFDMQLDTFGRIWMNSINGKIFYYSPELDSIIDDPFINSKKNVVTGIKPSYYFDNKFNRLHVGHQINRILNYTEYDLTNKKIESKYPYFAWISKNGFLLCSVDSYGKKLPVTTFMTKYGTPILKFKELEGSNEVINLLNFLPFGKDHLLSTTKRVIILKKPEPLILHRVRINDADVLGDSTYYICYGVDYGLRKYDGINNFIKDKSDVILSNVSTSNFYSKNSTFWISSPTSGLYKIFNSGYDFKITNLNGIAEAIVLQDKFYIFFKDNRVGEFKIDEGSVSHVKNINYDVLVNNVSVVNNKIVVRAIEGQNYIFHNSRFEKIMGRESGGNKHLSGFYGFNIYEDVDKNYIWGTNSSGIMKYNIRSKTWKRAIKSRVYCLLINRVKKILVGTSSGLYTIENDSFEDEQRHSHPYLKRRIDFMVENVDSTIVLASKNEGIYLLKNDKVKFIDLYNQFDLNYIKGLYLHDNEVWLNTSKGIFLMSVDHFDVKIIDIINSYDGLPDEVINDILFLKDEVFFVYSSSIIKFSYKKKHKSKTHNIKPFIQSLFVNNSAYKISDTMTLTYDQNNLMLKLIALDYTQNGHLRYQYAINGGVYKDLDQERNLNLFQLAPGRYDISFRVQNKEMEWGEPKKYLITILPPWWQTWWFYIGVGFAISFFTYLFMYNKNQIQKKEANLKEEIRNLEKSALQAQMNPHFIFNSLNSIQKFILANDKELASEYLSKFASLIRLNLKSSNSEWILLHDEINLLNLYLELEKLRFKNKFEYVVDLNIEKDLINIIQIPPMLIQPIIENAILHGIAGIEKKGKITISISKNVLSQSIFVTVSDNGKGFSNKQNGLHQSLGSKITKKRLELISQNEKDNFKLSNLVDANNTIIGAKAELTIKYKIIEPNEP